MPEQFPVLEEFTKLLSVMNQQPWLTGEVPVDWGLAEVTLIYKKGQEEDPGNERLISLTGKVMGQITFSTITH